VRTVFLVICCGVPATYLITLQRQTVAAFDAYIREAEAAIDDTLRSDSFLWSEGSPERANRLQRGDILVQLWSGDQPLRVPDGLIHDWIGAVFVPRATLDNTLAVIQDYDNHRNIYKPDVIDSRLLSRRGDDFKIYLKLLKKKIIAVVLETEHEVHYSRLDRARCFCRSHTSRISEVQDAGTKSESVLPPDTGHGFLWRLYSYWKFREGTDGTVIECRAISLTRDIPSALKWAIQLIVRSVPKESLISTLEATRAVVANLRQKAEE
jgi:hypothetical protein